MITRDYFGCDSNVFEIVTDKLNKAYKAVERGFVSFGYARAAGELARVGRYDDAKRVIMKPKRGLTNLHFLCYSILYDERLREINIL